jgi:diguanylate cyclase (GGDEF)-like protein
MLALEAAVMAAVVLGLFRARSVLGLTPLYIVLGGLQYLEAMLSLQVQVVPGFPIYPASTVLFTATLVSVLLVYLKGDAVEARKLVYGLVLANGAAALVSLLIGWQLQLPGSVSPNLRAQDFFSSARISGIGTALLFVDVIGIILLYEFFSRYTRGVFTPFYLSLFSIVAVDNLLFTAAVHSANPNLMRLLLSGFMGKASTALFYSFVSFLYLKYVETRSVAVGTGDVSDVFQLLTYRQKYEQVRDRMVRDALTGLFNRGYFDEVLPEALAVAKRTGEPVSLLIMDVDKFKEINDGLSHMEGDRVLQLIARTLAQHSRSTDSPCRYGGDEFIVVLPGASLAAAAEFADRIRFALAAECRAASPPFPWGYIGTTIGIATYPTDEDVSSAEDLIRVADRRLYEGKQSGRDRVVTRTVSALQSS